MHTVVRLILPGSGAFLVSVAAVLSPALIERALLGSASGTLTWGPTLFRVLLLIHGVVLILVACVTRSVFGTLPVRATPDSRSAPTVALDTRTGAVLIGLSIIALGLRLWRLGSCLWFDEVLTVVEFVRHPIGEILTSFPNQNQHMLFSVLARVSVVTFGESAWSVRLPSVFFGVASLWALYLLGQRVVGTRDALLACALMTVSYHHVWFSQNARGYSGLLFFATLSTWLWLEARARRSWPWHLGYAAVSALGMWTHMTMGFVVVSHALIHTVDTALRAATTPALRSAGALVHEFAQPAAAWILTLSLTLQLYALALPEFLRSGLHEVSLESEWTNPFWVVTESVRSLALGFGGLALVAGALVVAAASWLLLARRDWPTAVALVLPPALGGMVMLALGHNLWPRFFFFAMGFALLIGIHGVMELPSVIFARIPSLRPHARFAHAVGLSATILMIMLSTYSLGHAYEFPKQDFTGARDYVEQAQQPGDAKVAVGLAGVAYRDYFAPDWLVPDTHEELDAILRAHPRVWLVYTLPVELKAYRRDVWNVVEREFRIVKIFPGTLGGGEVNVCRGEGRG